MDNDRRIYKHYLLRLLYADIHQYYTKIFNNILHSQNRVSPHSKYSSNVALIWKDRVYWKNKTYSANHSLFRVKITPHETLHKEMEEYTQGVKDLDKEYKVVERFIVVLTNFCHSTKDIERVLGTTIYQALLTTLPITTNSTIPKFTPDEEIEAFKKEHQQYIDMINNRYLENIILSGVHHGN